RAHRLQHAADQRRALVVRFGKEGKVLLRHAEKMYFGLGLDVFEDDHLVVLIHFGGGDLPRDDLAENAVIHMLTSVWVYSSVLGKSLESRNEQDEEREENPKELTGIPQRFCEAKALWEEEEQAL